jgi:hypothetical protein
MFEGQGNMRCICRVISSLRAPLSSTSPQAVDAKLKGMQAF